MFQSRLWAFSTLRYSYNNAAGNAQLLRAL
jgi:hypothetical protein